MKLILRAAGSNLFCATLDGAHVGYLLQTSDDWRIFDHFGTFLWCSPNKQEAVKKLVLKQKLKPIKEILP